MNSALRSNLHVSTIREHDPNRVSPAWLRYSPGTIANGEVVRHAFEDPSCHGVNWGGGLQRYKLSGEVTLVPCQTLYAWSSAAARLLLQLHRLVRLSQRCVLYVKKRLWRTVAD